MDHLVFRLHHNCTVDGVVVIGREAAYVERAIAALELIKRVDPVRYRRITADVRRVWVRLAPTRGNFILRSWTCSIDRQWVADEHTSIEEIALVITHEATHARLHRRGFGYEPENRARIERICIRRELALAARLGGLTHYVEGRLRLMEQMPDLSDVAQRKGALEALRRKLLSDGVLPRWCVGLIIAVPEVADRLIEWRRGRN